MARKRYPAEDIIGHLRTIEIETGKGLAIVDACRKLGITEQPYYRWKKEYGGLRVVAGETAQGPGTRECPPQALSGRSLPRQ